MYRLTGPSVEIEIEHRGDGFFRWHGVVGRMSGGSEGWIRPEALARTLVRYIREHERPPAQERHG
jgi:hypothetical protein